VNESSVPYLRFAINRVGYRRRVAGNFQDEPCRQRSNVRNKEGTLADVNTPASKSIVLQRGPWTGRTWLFLTTAVPTCTGVTFFLTTAALLVLLLLPV
jgi:hypothetical protein